jgi:hypothetical protein
MMRQTTTTVKIADTKVIFLNISFIHWFDVRWNSIYLYTDKYNNDVEKVRK